MTQRSTVDDQRQQFLVTRHPSSIKRPVALSETFVGELRSKLRGIIRFSHMGIGYDGG